MERHSPKNNLISASMDSWFQTKITMFSFLLVPVSLLLPTTKLRQGNIFSPVCHSFHVEGGCCLPLVLGVTATPPGRHPPRKTAPRETPPWADTSPSQTSPWADTPPGQTPLPQVDTPQADTPRGRHPPVQTPSGRHPPGQCMLGCVQQAGGIHPTGIHSCSEHGQCVQYP